MFKSFKRKNAESLFHDVPVPRFRRIERQARGILGTGGPPLGLALREFRRLIHPGLPSREKVEGTREEAEAALIAVRMSLRQIAASSQKI